MLTSCFIILYRRDDLQHQQENANKKTEHLVEPEKAKNDQEALDGELKKCQERYVAMFLCNHHCYVVTPFSLLKFCKSKPFYSCTLHTSTYVARTSYVCDLHLIHAHGAGLLYYNNYDASQFYVICYVIALLHTDYTICTGRDLTHIRVYVKVHQA